MSELAKRRMALQDNDIVRAVTGDVPLLGNELDDADLEFADPIFETIPTAEIGRAGGRLSWALIGAAALAAGIALLIVLVTGLGCSGVVELDPIGGSDDDDDAVDDDTEDGDADGDGYATEDGDCDDEDASVNPGAQEVPYDSVDNDCDGGDYNDDDALIEYDITTSGVYTIVATSADPWQTGDYELEVW